MTKRDKFKDTLFNKYLSSFDWTGFDFDFDSSNVQKEISKIQDNMASIEKEVEEAKKELEHNFVDAEKFWVAFKRNLFKRPITKALKESKPILIKNYQKIKIKQYPKDRVTIASIDIEDLENELRIPFDPAMRGLKVVSQLEDSLWSPFWDSLDIGVEKLTAITHCSPEDEWDSQKGIEVAREKLSRKVFKLKLKALNRMLAKIEILEEPLKEMKIDTQNKIGIIETKRRLMKDGHTLSDKVQGQVKSKDAIE